jgi:hypothetical protein
MWFAWPWQDIWPMGLTWSELADVMQPFLRSDLLMGLALTCYNPEKDSAYACAPEIAQHFNHLMKESP